MNVLLLFAIYHLAACDALSPNQSVSQERRPVRQQMQRRHREEVPTRTLGSPVRRGLAKDALVGVHSDSASSVRQDDHSRGKTQEVYLAESGGHVLSHRSSGPGTSHRKHSAPALMIGFIIGITATGMAVYTSTSGAGESITVSTGEQSSASEGSKNRMMHMKSEGYRERPKDASDLKEILRQDPLVRIAAWGKGEAKSVDDLFSELTTQKCELRWARNRRNKLYLQRKIRVLTVVLRAKTSKGEMVMKSACVKDWQHDTEKTHADDSRDVARKIKRTDNIQDEVETLLRSELGLESSWQKDNLVSESQTRLYFYGGKKHGKSFPGLTAKYTNVSLTVRVKNPVACEGMLGLPKGVEFQTSEATFLTDKERKWKWMKEIPEHHEDMEAATASDDEDDDANAH